MNRHDDGALPCSEPLGANVRECIMNMHNVGTKITEGSNGAIPCPSKDADGAARSKKGLAFERVCRSLDERYFEPALLESLQLVNDHRIFATRHRG